MADENDKYVKGIIVNVVEDNKAEQNGKGREDKLIKKGRK